MAARTDTTPNKSTSEDAPNTGAAQTSDPSSHQSWLDSFRAKRVEAPTIAQIVLFLDSTGALRAELPGIAGAPRRKITLSPDFLERNSELFVMLQDELLRLKREREATVPAPKAEYTDPEVARAARNAEIARERAEKFNLWLETLPRDRRELEIRKRDERLARAKAAELDRARHIWADIAENHSIDLANHVIPDPKRRPRKKVRMYGRQVSPQNLEAIRAAAKGEPAPKRPRTARPAKSVDLTKAIDLGDLL